ncbi:hypothetical protein RRF57_005857 [Xylaria bambusicola]|uniref:Uncharacterized protein n=1 Tax=Xylaria bambusicola TaxID=326684 RepID=A0AAN7Z6C4_9PEZI
MALLEVDVVRVYTAYDGSKRKYVFDGELRSQFQQPYDLETDDSSQKLRESLSARLRKGFAKY